MRCPTAGPSCIWDARTPFSWLPNREQDAVQLFWLVNAFHDHLADPPIGFGASDGAFEGDDPIIAQSLDGADTDARAARLRARRQRELHDAPDGTPGFMQMYLFGGADGDPFFWVSSGEDASIVYHEYTHGLSNRLITDASGYGALWWPQSGAMGEGWSDWYAFDELDRGGNLVDGPGADLRTGTYVEGTQDLIRSEPIDCAVGTTDPACPGTSGAGTGGYTFGDLGRVYGFPEVHADGEIWAQTLWQLRAGLIADHGRAAGIARVERLVTDAMRLSPPNPSFLDQRNAILQADAANAPSGQDFDRDLAGVRLARHGLVRVRRVGRVRRSTCSRTSRCRRRRMPGAPRCRASWRPTARRWPACASSSRRPGSGRELSATTGADGRYAIADVPAGTYPRFRAIVPRGYAGSTSGQRSRSPARAR